jgi:hypothetical protein
MRRVTIVVIGNGKTTRANLEALIEDVADSVDEVVLATVYDTAQSEGQIWAEQWAQDKEIPVLQYSENDYESLFAENALDELRFFMLWDDSDSECQLAASQAQRVNVPVFDLTDGLVRVNIEDAPAIPEPVKAPEHEIVEELPEETDEEIISGDVEELDFEEAIAQTIHSLASLIVSQLMHEIAGIVKDGMDLDE